MSETNTVFLSYRRDASRYLARAIFLDLRANGWDVFYDVESINAGNFETIIQNQLRARAHFLILITPGTLERCADPNDWVRREVELAFELGRNIVPLLAGGMTFNDETRRLLPGRLADLVRVQALEVPPEDMYFDAAMTLLRTRFLRQPVVGTVQPAPVNEQVEVERILEINAAQPPPTPAQLTAEDFFRRAMRRNDNSEDELADYTEAIRLNPTYAEAWNNRGVVRASRGDHAAAMADYTESIRLRPRYSEAHNNRGNARKALGDLDGAIDDYTRSIEYGNPEPWLVYTNRGLAKKVKNDLHGAAADYTEAIRLNPDFADAWNNRGVVRSQMGDRLGAIDDYTEALRLRPNDANAFYNRGAARNANDDAELADYTEAIRLDPSFANAYYNRAMVYEVRGDFRAAIVDYQRYLDLGGGARDGDQQQVEAKIARLRRITAKI